MTSGTNQLDINSENYDIFISNEDSELKLKDAEHSSAGNFSILLEPHLDLSSFLFLKAIDAEISVQKLHVDALPLTNSRLEHCQIDLIIPPNVVEGNRCFNRTELNNDNKHPLFISLDDNICESPDKLVDYVNKKFENRINNFILARYFKICCDDDILEKSEDLVSIEDYRLLNRYLDLILFTRKVWHEYLCQITNDSTTTTKKIIFSTQKPIAQKKEDEILAVSTTLKSKTERGFEDVPKSVDLSIFYGVDITKDALTDEKLLAASQTIRRNITEWLTSLGIILIRNFVHKDDVNDVKGYMESNKALIAMSLKLREILNLQRDKIEGRIKNEMFHRDIFKLELDGSQSKCKFLLQPRRFLASKSTMTIFFPKHLSYRLGGEYNERIIVGPFDDTMPSLKEPRLSNQILAPNQQLYSNCRNMPRIVHLVSDIAVSKCRDQWLEKSEFQDYQIIYSFAMDECTLRGKCLTNAKCDEGYYKIKSACRILDKMNFALIDESFRPIIFPQRTFCRISLRIRPVSLS